jgi:hypothetical protein
MIIVPPWMLAGPITIMYMCVCSNYVPNTCFTSLGTLRAQQKIQYGVITNIIAFSKLKTSACRCECRCPCGCECACTHAHARALARACARARAHGRACERARARACAHARVRALRVHVCAACTCVRACCGLPTPPASSAWRPAQSRRCCNRCSHSRRQLSHRS